MSSDLSFPIRLVSMYKPDDIFKMFGYIVRFEIFFLFIWLGWVFTGLWSTSPSHTSARTSQCYLDNFFDLEVGGFQKKERNVVFVTFICKGKTKHQRTENTSEVVLRDFSDTSRCEFV